MHPAIQELVEAWTPLTITMANGQRREVTAKRLQIFVAKLAVAENGCWHWTGYLAPTGYGLTKIQRVGVNVHRFSYLVFVGDIPDGMHLDHTCHTEAIERKECAGGEGCLHRRCANPFHLKAVTPRENVLISLSVTAENAKRTHCMNGHSLEGDDLHLRASGGRVCYQCRRDIERRRHREKAAEEGRTVLPLPQDRTHCVNGHPFDETNTRLDKRGFRVCRACANGRSRTRKRAKER